MATIILTDNGSSRAGATLQLRKIANALGEKTGTTVHPVSLMHADRIDSSELGGIPADVLQNFLEKKLRQGETSFLLLPLFFGKSRALTSFIPDLHTQLREQYGDFRLRVAEVTYPLPEGEPRLADIIVDNIQTTASSANLPPENIVLVDHGSPSPVVTRVRNHLSASIREKLGHEYTLDEAVMERREGKAYDFNGELLEEWLLQKADSGARSAIVALLFFLPGRHAGKGGDIETICQKITAQHPAFDIVITPLIGEHPLLLSILESRLMGLTG